MKKGAFIVIDGTDGSGKGTQTKLLVDRLRKEGREVMELDFPQYGKPSAVFVEKYLRGEYGTADEVGPYRGSLFYALDRFDKSSEVKKWLSEGKVVVSNRYVSANMGHQTGKIKGKAARDRFLKWLDELEFGIFGIPRPDKVILLYMPPEVGQKLVDQKGKREYTKGKKRDIHEADLNHLKNAAGAYAYVAKKYRWDVIGCAKGEKILSREDVHDKLWATIKRLI
ncbi:MAG: thymidylate kinase [Candidatus Taylorbacteria bacterium]|nr:thymidylate kinase [Candidatus Taylorbacteria bacterium]